MTVSRAWSPGRLAESMERRFSERVAIGDPDECWLWTGATRSGYGVISTGGGRKVYAHRFALARAAGDRLAMFACHHCDVRLCCNPTHLFWGTAADNNRDARIKGRLLKAACRRGHPKTSENTYERVDSRGYTERHCRPCQQMRKAA